MVRLLQRSGIYRLSNCMKGVFIFDWWIAQKNVWCTWRTGCQRTMLPVTDYSFQDSREYSAGTLSCLNKSWPTKTWLSPQKYVYLVVFDTNLFVSIYQVPKSNRIRLWLNDSQFVKFPNFPLQLKLKLLTGCQKGSLAPVNAAPGNYWALSEFDRWQQATPPLLSIVDYKTEFQVFEEKKIKWGRDSGQTFYSFSVWMLWGPTLHHLDSKESNFINDFQSVFLASFLPISQNLIPILVGLEST